MSKGKKPAAALLAIAALLFLAACTSLTLPSDADLSKDGVWVIGDFVDEFGFDTGDRYVGSFIIGDFSNSATEKSDLSGKVLIYTENSQPTIRLDMLEYGSHPVSIIGNTARFAAANSNGERLAEGYGSVTNKGIKLYNQNATPIINSLARGENVMIVIDGNYGSRWRATISGKGFGYQLQQYLND